MMENITKKKYVQLIEVRSTGSGAGAVAGAAPKPKFTGRALVADVPAATIAGLEISKVKLDELNKAMEEGAIKATELAQAETLLGNLTTNVFTGMANIITSSLNSTENVFKAFWKYFTDFIKGMIIKLIAATIAALALAAVLSLIGLGGGGIAKTIANIGKFKDFFKMGFEAFGGFKLQKGAFTVPSGYPNDSFGPAWLSSGETVLTPHQLKNIGGRQEILIRTDITQGENIHWVVEEYKRRADNSF